MPVILLLAGAVAVLPWVAELGGSVKTNAAGAVVEAGFRTTWIEDSDLPRVAAWSELRSLDLAHTRITDVGFRGLKPLTRVEVLDLYYAEQTGDGVLAIVRNWRSLKRLNLRGTKVTDAGVAQLSEHPALESLDVGFSLFTDGGFESLTTVPKLRELAVGGNKVTDVGINYVRLMPGLRRLDLSGTQRTDSGPWSVTLTDRGIDAIATLRQLEELNVRGAKLTSAGAAKLRALTALRALEIGDTQVTGADVAAVVAGMPGLQRLSLAGCSKVDDAAAEALASLQSLTWLDVSGTGLTEAAIGKLRQARPKLRIRTGP